MSENTNAGGGELYDKLMALRLEAAEFADEAADNSSGPTSAFEAKERGRASAFAQAAEMVKAAAPAPWPVRTVDGVEDLPTADALIEKGMGALADSTRYAIEREADGIVNVFAPEAPPALRQGIFAALFRAEVRRIEAARKAALSAQSTGSGGVAAEPVAWFERVRHVKRGTEYEVLGEAEVQCGGPPLDDSIIMEGDRVIVYRGDDGKLWVREAEEFRDGRFETLAAAPTPPAGGGETKITASDGDETDASYIGGAAMQVIGTIAEAAGFWGRPEIEAALKYFGGEGWTKGQEILPFVMAEHVEPSPAAPRKGPSEEEIRHAQLRLQQARNCIHGGNASSSTAEMLRALAGTAISWPLDGGMYPHHVRERASLLEAAIKLTDFDLAALLTPADRGETQAVGDGWLPINTAPKDGQLIGVAGGCAYWNVVHKCWCSAVSSAYGRPLQWEPTHWKNLDYTTLPSPSPDQNRGEPDQGGANTEAGR